MNLSASMIKELREKSGAGMMDCKKALLETKCNMEDAIDWLRKQGLSAVAKKSGRVAAEGLIGISIKDIKGAMIEINSETDFVARNELFQSFVKNCSDLVLTSKSDIKTLKNLPFQNSERTVDQELTNNIATIGENMNIRRVEYIEVSEGVLASYVHNKVAEREKEVLIEQAISSGKSKEIAEKMVQGRMQKFFQEVVLNEQVSVIDGETKIKDIINKLTIELGTQVVIKDFKIFKLGEGIEVAENDFAAEVAATAGIK